MRRFWGLALFVLPMFASAATPNEGVELQIRRGFWAETDIGAFFTLGGNDHYSNAETYLQLGIGYDVGEHLEVGAQFGMGASNANCFETGTAQAGNCSSSDSFTLSFIDGSLGYLIPLTGRLYLVPKILAGYAFLDPSPAKNDRRGFNAGAAAGVEFATALDHFSVGADVSFRYVIGPDVPTFAVFPRIKYTF